MNKNEIIEAYLFLRKNNHSISDATLDFMKEASLAALNKPSVDVGVKAPTDNGIEHLDNICEAFNSGEIDLTKLICGIWNTAQAIDSVPVDVQELAREIALKRYPIKWIAGWRNHEVNKTARNNCQDDLLAMASRLQGGE